MIVRGGISIVMRWNIYGIVGIIYCIVGEGYTVISFTTGEDYILIPVIMGVNWRFRGVL